MQLIKRLTQTLSAGSTSLTFTDSMINDNSIIDVKGDSFEIYPTAASQTGTSVTVTFDAQTEAHSILLLINNIVSLSDPELATLLDVDLSTLSDDDILTYDEDTDKWINASERTAENIVYDNTDSGLEATNVQDAIDELANEKVDWNDYAQTGVVNLCENIFISQVISDITFTKNSDGSLTVNGTASAGIVSYERTGGYIFNTTLKAGTYNLSVGENDTRIFYKIGSGPNTRIFTDNVTINIDTDNTAFIVWFSCANGFSINKTYYPMLTFANYSGNYVPFAKTNKELTNIISCPVDTNGTYILQAVVSSGAVTYSWVASS